MNRWPIRLRLAFWTGLLIFTLLVLFGLGCAYNLYSEQLDALTKETGQPGEKEKAEAREIVGDLMDGYLLFMPVATLLAAAGSWWIAGRSLRPLSQMTATAEHIHAHSLGQQLDVPPGEDEVQRLTVVLNSMLDRLRRSFEQARHFAANASHELKTPLTIMRGEIEAAIKQCPPSDAPRARLLDGLLRQTRALSTICSDLLFLARADAGRLEITTQRMDLTALCKNLLEDAGILATDHQITFQNELTPGLQIHADPSSLHRALLNLLQNAIQYNDLGGSVALRLTTADTEIRIEIENTGPGIPASEIPQLFTRFHRGADHRGRSEGHGLGLSICREIIQQAGGTIDLRHSRPGSTVFEVRLPLTLG